MIDQSTIDLLKAMRFSAMAAELEKQLNDPASYSKIGFEDRAALMVDAEWTRRQANKLQRYIRNARFSIPSATIEGIEYYEDRKLDKAAMLRFSTCKYIDDNHHIVLKGASGNGKTYIACALGNAACRKFKAVRFVRMPELLDELTLARADGVFQKTIKTYRKVDLLILDEWLSDASHHRSPTICWKSLKPVAHTAPRFSAHSMRRRGGTNGLTPTRKTTARSPKQLWTVSSTTLTRFWLMAKSLCVNATGLRTVRTVHLFNG